MEAKGIKFKMKDGTWDYYDPIEEPDFQISQDAYVLDMNYLYEIPKEDVEYFEWYELCDDCGYEVFEEGCRNCADTRNKCSKEELKNL